MRNRKGDKGEVMQSKEQKGGNEHEEAIKTHTHKTMMTAAQE